MVAVQTPVDVTKLLVNYLLAALSPSYPGEFTRVYGNVTLPPGDADTPLEFPLVTIGTFGPGMDAIGHLTRPFVQFDVWDGGDIDATWDLVNAVRVAMHYLNVGGSHTEGVVTDSEEVLGPQQLADPPGGRRRFTFQFRVVAHP